MRATALVLLLFFPLLMWGESVVLRDRNLVADSICSFSHTPDYPAWSGSTRMVCAMGQRNWNIALVTSEADTANIALSWTKEMMLPEPVTSLTSEINFGDSSCTNTISERRGVRLNGSDYLISVSWDMTQGIALACNNNMMLSGIPITSPVKKVIVQSADGLRLTEWLTRAETVSPIHGKMDSDYISELLQTANDTISGIYQYFDRDTDPAKIHPGGFYKLALVPISGSEQYALCYLDGATVNPQFWTPGTVKAILIPTEFERHYTLKWLDAEFNELDAEQYAEFVDGNILRLVFPLYKSSMRLVRNPE